MLSRDQEVEEFREHFGKVFAAMISTTSCEQLNVLTPSLLTNSNLPSLIFRYISLRRHTWRLDLSGVLILDQYMAAGGESVFERIYIFSPSTEIDDA